VSYHCIGYYPKIKQVVDSSCIASFREWATAGGGMQYVLMSGSLRILLSCYHGKK
jgi:hypothetical protein